MYRQDSPVKEKINFNIMKRFFILFIMTVAVLSVSAVPAKRGVWKKITLENGTTLDAQLRGDEFSHYYEDKDGVCYTENESGLFSMANMDEVMAKGNGRRAQTMSYQQRLARKAARNRTSAYNGLKKGLIILVEFADMAFADGHDRALFNNIANKENYTSDEGFIGSVRDYFLAQSNGTFAIDFDVAGPVVMSQNYAYYGKDYGGLGNDMRPGEMVVEACRAVDQDVDFSAYDWDGDGEADQVFVLYAGLGQAAGGSANTIWPHMWALSDPDNYGSSITLDNVVIDIYACSSELAVSDSGQQGIAGIGTICHEFSHCLGFPDMYDTVGYNFGMFTWDLMDYGSYNGDGFIPSGYTCYEKMMAGWITPTELTENTSVSNLKPCSEGGEAYVIYNDSHRDEFYLLENRQQTGWDAAQYGNGLLIMHVDYDATVWEENTVNNVASRQRCTIFHADNSDGDVDYAGYIDEDDVAGDPYPYGTNNSLTNTTTPKALLYNANTDGSMLMNKDITDITRHADGTVSFCFSVNGGGSDDADIQWYESFDKCSGKGGNDGLWSGSIASSSFTPDLQGWTSSTGSCYGANQCARFGTSSTTGIIQSPLVTVDGELTITFLAAPWNAENTTLQLLTLDDNAGITITPSAFALTPKEWTSCTATISGKGSVNLKFVPSTNRFFLDEVKVTKPSASGIALPGMSVKTDPHIYSVSGQYMGTSVTALPKGIYIRDGRKFVK